MTISLKMLSLLRDPVDGGPLELNGGTLINKTSQRLYPINDSIPVLLDDARLGPQNRKTQKMYQWMARGFDLSERIGNLLTRGSINKMRRQLACRLGVKHGDRLLYTSIGTGLDLPFLAEQVPLDSLELVGLDLSMEMLRKCQSKMHGYSDTAMLVQANAERLPLTGGSFDVVLHVGGINQFDQPAIAVQEMLRVAKPGARLVIADETQKVVKSQYQKWNPFTRSTFKDMPVNFDPLNWIPADIKDAEYQEIAQGKIYFLTFTAPL